jgi:RNA polymerase sigma-70 factor (ECF subfamily)
MQRSGKHLSKKIGTTGKRARCRPVNEGGKGQKGLKREPGRQAPPQSLRTAFDCIRETRSLITLIDLNLSVNALRASGEQQLNLNTNEFSDDWSGPDVAPGRLADPQVVESLNDVLLQVAEGDRAAFLTLYRATSPKLFGVCLRILRDRSAAEDVLQELYATVWRRADSFDPARASALTWLTTIARNRAIDRIRERREVPLDEGGEDWLVDENPSPMSTRRRLQACLDELVPQQGYAIKEAFYTGASYSELAERAEVPLGTMKSWIRRSLLLLKACLQR